MAVFLVISDVRKVKGVFLLLEHYAELPVLIWLSICSVGLQLINFINHSFFH